MLRAIDLFSGAGGLSLGLAQAGIKAVCAVEIDPCRVTTYLAHSPGTRVLAGDISGILFSPYQGKVELVCGGPPCQPFSSGGRRQAESDPRNMIPHFV